MEVAKDSPCPQLTPLSDLRSPSSLFRQNSPHSVTPTASQCAEMAVPDGAELGWLHNVTFFAGKCMSALAAKRNEANVFEPF